MAGPLDGPEAADAAPRDRRLLVAPSVRRLQLGDSAALFCERDQRLFELNPTADLIWRGLAAGETPAAVAGRLEALGAAPEAAAEFVAASAAAWIRGGQLLPAETAVRRHAPAQSLDLRLETYACRLSLGLEPGDPLLSQVRSIFGQFAAPPVPAADEFSVLGQPDGYLLFDGELPLGLFSPERIVPELKAVLTERLSRTVRGGEFLLHAALLAQAGRGLLICGAPGAGKTTLTTALAARGLGYGSDDVVRVTADGRLSGVPFSPASKSGAWELLGAYAPGLADLPAHVRADGQRVRYLPVAGFAPAPVQRLGWVLLLDRRAGARAALEPAAPLAALTELLAASFAADRRLAADTLEAFAAAVAQAACARLVYADLAEAVALIEETVGG